MTPSNTQRIDAGDGVRLNVEIFEHSLPQSANSVRANVTAPQSRPTLILTHGWTLDCTAWDYLMPALTKRFRVVRYDLAGLGGSTGPSDLNHSLERMAKHLKVVVDTTSRDTPVVLVGHSIGGMILQTYARLYADSLGRRAGNGVCALVLMHTTYINPLRTMIASGLVTSLQHVLVVPVNYLTIALAPVAWLSNWQSYWNGSLHLWSRMISFSGKQTFEQLERGARLAARAWPATVARGNLAMLELNEEQTLPAIGVPVLVVSGKHDLITKPSASEHIAERLPDHHEFRDQGGHLGYWEYADEVTERLVVFLDSIRITSVPKEPAIARQQ